MRKMTPRVSRRSGVVVVLVTCPTPAVGRKLASRLIERRLAACVNLVPAVESVFRWRGKTERCREALLVVKTTSARFQALKAKWREYNLKKGRDMASE